MSQSLSQKNTSNVDLKQGENSLLLQQRDQDSGGETDSPSEESRPGSSHSFLQLHPPVSTLACRAKKKSFFFFFYSFF